jgi:hypothetical protein
MIKRLLCTLALLALPALASAQTVDRDTLLAPDGTLYTVETVFGNGSDPLMISNEYLLLTAQDGAKSTIMKVPGSITGGLHTSPALAYDSDGETLFIFWEQSINNRLSTSLLFTSYQNGKWGPTTELDAANYRLRHNLRIAVTHKTQDFDVEGHPFINELTVHAIWWEETGSGEWARYAMLTCEKGNVTSIRVSDASDFINDSSFLPYQTDSEFNSNILRYPQVFESPTHDTVDLVFGDLQTSAFRRLTVQAVVKKDPVTNLRIRIPVGIRNSRFPAPANKGNAISNVAGAVSGDRDHLAFYAVQQGAVNYTMFRNGTWSTVRSIALNEKISADTAVNALRRLLTSE